METVIHVGTPTHDTEIPKEEENLDGLATSAPETAIGNKPTGVKTEKRPPTSSGITNVS